MTSRDFQCIETLGGKVPIITIQDFANVISLTVQISWNPLCMQIYVMVRAI